MQGPDRETSTSKGRVSFEVPSSSLKKLTKASSTSSTEEESLPLLSWIAGIKFFWCLWLIRAWKKEVPLSLSLKKLHLSFWAKNIHLANLRVSNFWRRWASKAWYWRLSLSLWTAVWRAFKAISALVTLSDMWLKWAHMLKNLKHLLPFAWCDSKRMMAREWSEKAPGLPNCTCT